MFSGTSTGTGISERTGNQNKPRVGKAIRRRTPRCARVTEGLEGVRSPRRARRIR
jgi:hypothetical protein